MYGRSLDANQIDCWNCLLEACTYVRDLGNNDTHQILSVVIILLAVRRKCKLVFFL
jgi:hypothetical protein